MSDLRTSDLGYAIITGASQGIGKAIALELASKGFGVVLVARSAAALEAVAEEAGQRNGGRAHVLVQDLATPVGVQELVAKVDRLGLRVTCLVNNAGYGLYGRFSDLSVEEQQGMMHLNMSVPVTLTHHFLPRLMEEKQAYILNVSSMSAYSSVATLAVYSGSKAFLLRWSRALRLELKGTGVKVTAVCPGSVNTGFIARAGMGALQDLADKFGTGPEPVAASAVRAMLKGKAEVVPGLLNAITGWLQRKMPTALGETIASGIYLKRLR